MNPYPATPSLALEPLAVGAGLGDFTLMRQLGQGGAGSVWLASNRYTQQEVALKICHDGSLAATLADEARHLGRLMAAGREGNFPESIVRLYETHLSEAPPYLVMEYVPGGDLRAELERHNGRLPEKRVAEIMSGVLTALKFAHGLGIVHRDIKPENVLLSPEGHPRVTDFGLGVAVERNVLSMRRSLVTAANPSPSFGGTFDYMAPEQLTGTATSGPAADIYALGVVMYELLTGDRPRGLTTPSRRRPEIHVAWDRLFQKSYAHDPSDRFASAAEFQAELHESLGHVYGGMMAPGTPPKHQQEEAPSLQPPPPLKRTESSHPAPKAAPSTTEHTAPVANWGHAIYGALIPIVMWGYLGTMGWMKMVYPEQPIAWGDALILAPAVLSFLVFSIVVRWRALGNGRRTLLACGSLVAFPFALWAISVLMRYLGVVTVSGAVLLHAHLLNTIGRKLSGRK